LRQHLADAGVDSLIHYPIPPHKQKAYASMGFANSAFPIASRIADEALSLPIGPHLDAASVTQVIASLDSFAGS
jgi:dTDP-4-amino-4,6-dideoxygalactose transaminase